MDARCSYGRRERSQSDGRAHEKRGAEFGDAGALVTGDPRLAARVRALREHGQNAKHRHEAVGYTARLDTVQAAVLLRKLPLFPEWTEERHSIASAYSEALEGVGDLRLPPVPPGSEPVWHLYELRTGRADELAAFLDERGIQTGAALPVTGAPDASVRTFRPWTRRLPGERGTRARARLLTHLPWPR
jgi:dTDP-4-amino-4,6-dideoxygalactose transaminase